MRSITELKRRNPLLFWFGLFNLFVGITCLALMQADDQQVLNVSRWLKPMKFYFSVGIMILTMGWLLYYLDDLKKIKRFTWLLIITMFFENGLILLQAIRGTTSHFNTKTVFDNVIFSSMGIFIAVFTVVCARICISFFRQKQFAIDDAYLWGIRLGLLFFILFSLEGGMMLTLLKHTVGAPDGGPGLALMNWSREHGDLRIAHFAGIHSLQVLPLLGFYIARTKKQIIIFSFVYFLFVLTLLVRALMDVPLFF